MGILFPDGKCTNEDLITMVDTKPTMESFVQTQRHTLEPILLKMHLLAGISNRFDNLLNLSTYLYQAKHALILGKSNSEPHLISIYNDLVVLITLTP